MKIIKIDSNSPHFPAILHTIPDPPKQLFVLGSGLQNLLEQPRLAVVGSRAVTPYGKTVTYQLVGEAAAAGVVIISGLALGLDGEAHRAALSSQGRTIAVLPCGLDQICPRTHRNLAKQILEQRGVLISEYPPGTPPHQHHFIARNRLIAGLAQAVLIPEAAAKSGSLYTAQFALDQGREVLAVPGNITSYTSGGTNNLIKTGATPVTTAGDIFTTLGIDNTAQQTLPLANTAEEDLIIKLIKQGTSDASELLAHSKLSTAVFNQTLTMLEITGRIKPLGANHWIVTHIN